MAVNATFLAMWVVGILVLVAVLYLITQVRPWHYPVRDTEIDLGVRKPTSALGSRGPSGKMPEQFEAEEPREPQTRWERVKLHLYTFQKRPAKRQ
jgi:hypothetical protein